MFAISQSPVFLINSRFFYFLVAYKSFLSEFKYKYKIKLLRAPLLPKLQSQFAEFLQDSSLNRLSIFYLSTCVGFQYGTQLAFPGWFFISWYFILLSIRHPYLPCCAFFSSLFFKESSIELSLQIFILRNRLILHNFHLFVENLGFLAITIF